MSNIVGGVNFKLIVNKMVNIVIVFNLMNNFKEFVLLR